MVVAVHGPGLARGARFRLLRLLRALLISAGLSALAWMLIALFSSGSASADSTSPTRSGSGGLLGGLVNGLTSTIDRVTGTVTGSASATVPTAPAEAELPVITTPGTVSGGVTATKPVSAKPAAAQRVVPVAKPAAPKPAVAAKPAAVKRASRAVAPVHHQVVAHKATPVAVKPLEAPRPDNQANRPGPERAPTKVPLAPAAPSGSVSAGHDGPGTARGAHGVLPAVATVTSPAEVCVAQDAQRDVAGRGAGLPATSPD